VESFCDSGSLFDGRAGLGPEANAPSTLSGSCADGLAGVYHEDESLDWIKVSSVDGLPLAPGKLARVEARVWSFTGFSDEALDLYYATHPDDVQWIWFATVKPSGPGAQTLVAEYVLPPSGLQAIRGRFRYGGSPAPCGAGLYDDHDDLVFATSYTANALHDRKLKVPACAESGPYCDSGALLDGRATLGPEPNAPNTLAGACLDGTSGAYHVEPSVDGILVATPDGSALRSGGIARIEVRVWGSASWSAERVDLFTSTNPDATSPAWQHLASLSPGRAGSQVLFEDVPLAAGKMAIRAHISRPVDAADPPLACGTSQTADVIDDQDDLVFEVAP
jgi:hypothetical protein